MGAEVLKNGTGEMCKYCFLQDLLGAATTCCGLDLMYRGRGGVAEWPKLFAMGLRGQPSLTKDRVSLEEIKEDCTCFVAKYAGSPVREGCLTYSAAAD